MNFKPVKTAKAMANLSDKWWELRAQRLQMQKEVEKIAELEHKAKAALIASLVSTKSSAAGGKLVTVKHVIKEKPVVSDWDQVWHWAIEHDSPDLYQRRVSETAVKARWEDGIIIPGIEAMELDDISYSQIK